MFQETAIFELQKLDASNEKTAYTRLFKAFLRLAAQDAYHNALNTQLQTNYSLPAVTQWVLPNTESATLNGAGNYGATVTSITPTGQIFSQPRRLVVTYFTPTNTLF